MCPKWYKVYTNLDYDNDKDITINIGPNDAYNYTLGSYNAPTSVSGASATNTPSPTAGGGGQQSQGDSTFYGCIASACVPTAISTGTGVVLYGVHPVRKSAIIKINFIFKFMQSPFPLLSYQLFFQANICSLLELSRFECQVLHLLKVILVM